MVFLRKKKAVARKGIASKYSSTSFISLRSRNVTTPSLSFNSGFKKQNSTSSRESFPPLSVATESDFRGYGAHATEGDSKDPTPVRRMSDMNQGETFFEGSLLGWCDAEGIGTQFIESLEKMWLVGALNTILELIHWLEGGRSLSVQVVWGGEGPK
jgi:hypothetical protein